MDDSMSSHRRSRSLLALVLFLVFVILVDGFTGVLGFSDLLAFYRSQHVDAHWANTWFGIRLSQFPRDLLTYAELIHTQQPEVIVETGTWWGGSAAFFASTLSDVRADGLVITIDIKDDWWQQTLTAKKIPEPLLAKIVFIEGDSTSDETLRQVQDRIRGKSCLFVFDSRHSKEHVLKELRSYAPLVGPGEYMIVNDTHHDLMFRRYWFRGGPQAAVKTFLAENDEFSVRKRGHRRARFTATRGGFLARAGKRPANP